MSQSYWRLIAAAGFLILASGFSGQHNGNAQRQDGAQAESQAQPSPQPKNLPTNRGESYAPSCDQPENQEEASFCIERRAVLAAEKANILSDKIYWPTLAGIIVGAASAAFAGWAAVAASRAAKAAEESLDHADDVMRKELRAYVHVERAEITWGLNGRNPQITLFASNTGQTPAKWFGVTSRVVEFEKSLPRMRADFDAVDLSGLKIYQWSSLGGSGGTLSFPGSRDDDVKTLKAAYGRPATLHVIGVLRYQTIFDEVFETEFWFIRSTTHKEKMSRPASAPSGVASYTDDKEVPQMMQRASIALDTYKDVSGD